MEMGGGEIIEGTLRSTGPDIDILRRVSRVTRHIKFELKRDWIW